MQEKTEQSPSPQSAASANEPDPVAGPDAQSDAADSQEMSAEEQAAFDKIMGDIEGSPPASNDDTHKNDPSPIDAASPPETTADSEEDFSAELEKVAKAAASDAEEPVADTVPAESEDDLDADQQQAFENIMAQIQGGSDGDDPKDDPDSGDPSAADSEEDFSAELEKVAKAAASDAEEPVADPAPAESEDDLDADQQQAFENIMAQIGNADGSDREEKHAVAPGGPATRPSDDDASAELEQAEPPADGEGADHQNDASETQDAGDEDRLATAGNSNPASESDAVSETIDAATDDPASDNSGGQAPTAEATESDAEDISDDIDDILKDIASADSDAPGEEACDNSSETSSSDAQCDNRSTAARQPTDAGVPAVVPEAESATHHAQREPADDSSKATAQKHNHPEGPQPEAIEPPSSQPAGPLQETLQPAGRSKKALMLFSGAAILLLVVAVSTYFQGLWGLTPTPPVADRASQRAAEEEPTEVVSALPQRQAMINPQMETDQSRLNRVAQDLEQLRDRLVAKQNEIEELRAYYQAGIDAEIQGIVTAARQAGNRKPAFKKAIQDQRIHLGLLAIQRRDAYMQKLVSPANELIWDSEALLYHARRAHILSLMADKTSDVDVEGFIQQATGIHDRYHRALAALNIDGATAAPLSLELIWRDIAERLPDKPAKHRSGSARGEADNAAIAKSICSGDYSQKHHLTELSPKTARCLARWEGKDLFLNELSELLPEAASQLADWDGEWLGLNGLRELTPESATHLSRWQGKGLSLNGLTRLSPRVVAILSEWDGEQIELVNVKHIAHWENPNTRLFLSEGLKRKSNLARN